MVNHEGLDFSTYSYAELLSQLQRPYATVPEKPQMITGVIAKEANELVNHCHWIDRANATIDDFRM